jgi:hypothetical protein
VMRQRDDAKQSTRPMYLRLSSAGIHPSRSR